MPSTDDLFSAALDQAIRRRFRNVISETNMQTVEDALRKIASQHGLGVAILVAWQHGLRIRHIPLAPGKQQIEPEYDGTTVYRFVYIPVRKFRGDKTVLAKKKIMNPNADPAWFIYHEDGLVGTFSFKKSAKIKLSEKDKEAILEVLQKQGLLIRADVNNRQIQFKDLTAKRTIERSKRQAYVKVEKQLERTDLKLPRGSKKPGLWEYVEDTLRFKTACNYCSVQTLNPREATIHSANIRTSGGPQEDVLSTVRNYQFGFTYAPFGDPTKVCHFLAWDFPHISDRVMNMDPQSYSFSDLVKLVRVINRDIARFCKNTGTKHFDPISGVCNHWAGNTIYHQHFQFFRISRIPLLACETEEVPLASYKNVCVAKYVWPAPAYRVSSDLPHEDEDVRLAAGTVANLWEMLNDGFDDGFGNGIRVKKHTQNICVTVQEDALKAIFIPRHREKLGTTGLRKGNAGVLEMMGYFIIDDKKAFNKVAVRSRDWAGLGDSWLKQVAPDPLKIQEFERWVRVCVCDRVISYEKGLERAIASSAAENEVWELEAEVSKDKSLDQQQRSYLLWAFNEAWKKKSGENLFY